VVWWTTLERGRRLPWNRSRGWLTVLASATLLGAAGCGSGDGDKDSAPPKPDTGYGKAALVPSARTCTDLCTRAADCAEHLCNEDSHSSRYTGLGDILDVQCESMCTDALVNSNITTEEWQCLFQDSCRQVFDYDTCNTQSSYYCN
jgi:hypothetical protein